MGLIMKNPMQPIIRGGDGVLRFKENAIISHLLEWAQQRGHGLNGIAMMEFSNDDREQFAQLIGYSLSGYGDLSYVSDTTYHAAEKMAHEGLSDKDARIACLEYELDSIRTALRGPMAKLFGVHPDDLKDNC